MKKCEVCDTEYQKFREIENEQERDIISLCPDCYRDLEVIAEHGRQNEGDCSIYALYLIDAEKGGMKEKEAKHYFLFDFLPGDESGRLVISKHLKNWLQANGQEAGFSYDIWPTKHIIILKSDFICNLNNRI